jgi:spectinomycin phosphotransferase
VDTPPPATLDERDIAAALAANWEFAADDVRYLPKGLGSYHWEARTQRGSACFVTVDDLATKPWIAPGHDDTFDGLTAAYRTASILHHQAGLHLVVAPYPCLDGRLTLRLSPQFSMAVFPFVDGRAGDWGEPITPAARARLLGELAMLHLATPEAGSHLTTRPFELPGRPGLTAALGAVDQPWTGGPLSESARRALAEHAGRVHGQLSAFDDLARQVEESRETLVITHGEPHPGNLMHTEHGLRLIDWDTVALARPERDLWMLDDGSSDGFAPYSQLTGQIVNRAAIEFYRLEWTLSDIASFIAMFRSEHRRTVWIEQKWRGFGQLLAGAPSSPYAAG